MKAKQFLMSVVLSGAALLLASNCYAQTNIAPLFNGAGSSGSFNALALAARISNTGGGSGVCGDHSWTKKSGTATGIDNRNSGITAAGGSIWVVWDDTPEPNRKVCSYLNVDSIVGNRLFWASPTGTVSLPSSAIGEAGDQIVPLLPADEPLPQNIYNDLNNQPFNAAPTDIRPEDAQFGTTRALTAAPMGLGYGPGPIGANILSPFSSKSSQVVAFNISGTDPITGQAVKHASTLSVGGQVLLVLVNSTNTGVGHLGNSAFNNVDRFPLGYTFSGQLTRTRDLIPSTGLPVVPLTILTREPLSGTMNTFEFCIPRNFEINSTQELNVNAITDNPLNQTLADGAKRQRVIGTGEMISELGLLPDSIGYAFFSFGNVAPDVTTAKYLTVDGVDPLFASYSGGALPTCTAPCPGAVTFNHVIDGSYPIWNVLRVVTLQPPPAGVANLVSAAQTQVLNIPDFVPFSQLQVFRSHYNQAGVQPHNGHLGRTAESGGDVGGAVFTTQADLDNITDTGKEIVNKKQ